VLYNDALSIWETEDDNQNHDQYISHDYVSRSMIEEQIRWIKNSQELELLVKIYVERAKCLVNIGKGVEGAKSYEYAHYILKKSNFAQSIVDRSVILPVLSGLFLMLKFGHINDDSESTYEQKLVEDFIQESSLCDTNVHLARALAMQVTMFDRQRKFVQAHETLQVKGFKAISF